jgi:superfamily II DNA or RNA helicase
MDNNYYKDYNDKDFSKMLEKYEFEEKSKKDYLYQQPRQLLLRNFISKNTIYDNILLFWEVGVGKSCGAITIAEGFKEYVSNMGKKIVVLVKNKNIENNFRQEMLTECTKDSYINNNQRQVINTVSSEERKLFLNKINRKINKQYNFITYGTFVNQILGAKDYEKDDKGENLKQKVNAKGERVRKTPTRQLDFNNTVIIIDEVHNITNNDVYIALKKILEKSYNYRLVLLTATPMYDNPKEIVEITNILNMNRLKLPIRNKLFNDYIDIDNNGENHGPIMIRPESKNINTELIKGGIIRITENGKKILSKALNGKVSYLKADTSTFPKKIDIGEPLIKGKIGTMNVVYCEMSDFQTNVYIKSLSLDSNIDYNKKNITESVSNIQSMENGSGKSGSSKTDSLFKNSSDASTFVYPIGLYGKEGFESIFTKSTSGFKLKEMESNPFKGELLKKCSMKLFTLLENIKKSKGNTFIYSNYVNFGGTELVKQLLLQNGYKSYSSNNEPGKSFVLFDDSVAIETREKHKKIFNSKENARGDLIKIIIGSPIISEGITLKNVRQIHILEPSWNMSRINQIIGRGVRYKSHYDLPEEERDVEIYKYCSIKRNKKISSKLFIDEQKYVLSEEKDRSNKEIERILKQVAFDCNINDTNYDANYDDNYKGTAECDYTDCNYKCELKSDIDFNVDKDTYNAYIDFFDSFDIEFNINKIKELFKEYFIWNIKDIIEYIKKKSNANVSNESIYIALNNLVDNKLLLVDNYNRSGFLIRKDDYYIFNAENIDIDSSIYAKIFNFKEYNNKYTLNEFAKLENIKVNEQDIKETKKEKKKKEIKEYVLTEAQEEENEKIKTTKYPKNSDYNIYASFIKYNPTTEKYEDDTNLKIIVENGNDESDKRKVKTGMAISSFDKNINPKKPISLIQLAHVLNISTKKAKEYLKSLEIKEIDELGKGQLQKIISLELYNKGRILHPPSDTEIKKRLEN